MTPFAVKSKSFHLYRAFKEECEAMGWRYFYTISKFIHEEMSSNNCFYFGDYTIQGFGFSFSNYGYNDRVDLFSLETQYQEAVDFAKKELKLYKSLVVPKEMCNEISNKSIHISTMNEFDLEERIRELKKEVELKNIHIKGFQLERKDLYSQNKKLNDTITELHQTIQDYKEKEQWYNGQMKEAIGFTDQRVEYNELKAKYDLLNISLGSTIKYLQNENKAISDLKRENEFLKSLKNKLSVSGSTYYRHMCESKQKILNLENTNKKNIEKLSDQYNDISRYKNRISIIGYMVTQMNFCNCHRIKDKILKYIENYV